ncbi:MAG: DUF4214 domain-containing protein, partial [Actinobacteria bacterium]|nr:DUF4214 domain-containing protein [Actinomycetota bacterium]
ALYVRVLGLSPDPSGRTYWVGRLVQGMDRYNVAGAFINSETNHQNRVRFAYSWLLGRPVDAYALDYWTAHLNNGLRQDHMYAYLIGSPEYWSKV